MHVLMPTVTTSIMCLRVTCRVGVDSGSSVDVMTGDCEDLGAGPLLKLLVESLVGTQVGVPVSPDEGASITTSVDAEDRCSSLATVEAEAEVLGGGNGINGIPGVEEAMFEDNNLDWVPQIA